MANYPITLDDFTPKVDNTDDVMATDVNELQTAIEALETKVGIDDSEDVDSIDYRLSTLEENNTGSNTGDQSASDFDIKDLTDSTNLRTTWSGKQDALGFTPENSANKETSALDTSTTKYPCNNVVKTAVDTKAPLASPTFTGTVTLPKAVEIQDTSADHQYVLAVNELTADRTVTLPLLTGNDEFVFKDHAQTLTKKRINPRLVTATSYTTNTGTSLDVSTCDQFEVTAQAGALKFNNPSGTPVGGQKLIIRIKDNGTARALTYDTQFRAMGNALPSTTVVNKTLYLGFIYNATDSKWDLVAVVNEA